MSEALSTSVNQSVDSPAPEASSPVVAEPKRSKKLIFLGIAGVLLLGVIGVAALRSPNSKQTVTANASDPQGESKERKQQANAVQSIEETFSKNQTPETKAPDSSSPAPMQKQVKGIDSTPFDVNISPNSPVADALNATSKSTQTGRPEAGKPQTQTNSGGATVNTPGYQPSGPNQPARGQEPVSETQRRPVRSGYFFGNDAQPPSQPITATPVSTPSPVSIQQPSIIQRNRELKTPVAKPTFGTMLPVRLLGTLLTLGGQNLVRCEITRDVQGKGWKLARGTQMVGEIREGIGDRVFIRITGYIDSSLNKLIPIKCDVLGADGASGLPAERKRLNSRLAYFFGRFFDATIQLGQAALSRGNNVVIPTGQDLSVLTGVNPNGGVNAQTYLKINANTQGYALVVDIPGQLESSEPAASDFDIPLPGTPLNAGTPLASPQEMALIQGAQSESELRAILPQLNPRLRGVVLEALQKSVQ